MRYTILICLTLFGLFACGQQYAGSDSLFNNLKEQQRLDFLFRSVALMHDSVGQNFGVATLSFQTDERNFRTSQVAQSRSDAALETRGISYLGKKTVVSGMFSYQKSWEDSLSYFLAGLEDNRMPSYYFVEKAGQFERQTYRANAHVGYQFSNNWHLDGELDYTHHWATRSVDPRMDLYSMTWLFKPSVSYTVGNHFFAIQPIYGQGRGQTDLSYKNSSNPEGTENAMYHYISSYGYGTMQRLDTATLRQYDRYAGLNLQGKLQHGAYELLWEVGYLKRANESTHDVANMDNYFVAQSFVLETFHIDLLASQRGLNGASLRLFFVKDKGVDADRYRGQNYFLSQWKSGLTILKNVQQQSHWPMEFGLDLQANYDERDDAASSHYAERQWVELATPMAFTHVWNNQERLRWQIQPSLRIPLKNELTVPATQMNSFSKGIAYPEFYYYDVKSVAVQSRLTFITGKLRVKSPISFFLEASLTKPFHYDGDLLSGTLIYTGHNLRARAGISFYL